jgi:hypothetical protein
LPPPPTHAALQRKRDAEGKKKMNSVMVWVVVCVSMIAAQDTESQYFALMNVYTGLCKMLLKREETRKRKEQKYFFSPFFFIRSLHCSDMFITRSSHPQYFPSSCG